MSQRQRPTSAQRRRPGSAAQGEIKSARLGGQDELDFQSAEHGYSAVEWRQKLQAIQQARLQYSPGSPQDSHRETIEPAIRRRPTSATRRPTSAPRSGRRPTSAKSRSSGVAEPLSVRSRTTDPYLEQEIKRKQRSTPSTFYADQETMYEQIQKLKRLVHELTEERTQLRSKIIRFDEELTRKEKQMEQLLQSKSVTEVGGGKFEQMRTESHLLKNLKRNIASLEKTIAQKDEEINKLKSDSKYTHVAELELELRTYYNESRRLQKLLEAQTMDGTASISKSGASGSDEQLRQLQERNVQLRATNSKLQAQNEQLEQDMKLLTRENTTLSRQIDELRVLMKSKSQQTAEVGDLRTQLSSKEAEMARLEQQQQLKDQEFRSKQEILEAQLADKRSRVAELEEERSKYQQLWMTEESAGARLRAQVTAMERQLDEAKRQLSDSDHSVATLRAQLSTVAGTLSTPSPSAPSATSAPAPAPASVHSTPSVSSQPRSVPAPIPIPSRTSTSPAPSSPSSQKLKSPSSRTSQSVPPRVPSAGRMTPSPDASPRTKPKTQLPQPSQPQTRPATQQSTLGIASIADDQLHTDVSDEDLDMSEAPRPSPTASPRVTRKDTAQTVQSRPSITSAVLDLSASDTAPSPRTVAVLKQQPQQLHMSPRGADNTEISDDLSLERFDDDLDVSGSDGGF